MTYAPPISKLEAKKMLAYVAPSDSGDPQECFISVKMASMLLGRSPECLQETDFYICPGIITDNGYGRAAYVLHLPKLKAYADTDKGKGWSR
jgi:hypothetical protein